MKLNTSMCGAGLTHIGLAESAGAVEYTHCISAEGVTPPPPPGYDVNLIVGLS